MSVLNGRGRGDLVARILVETPTRMSAKQKKLLEEFRGDRDRRRMPRGEELLRPRSRNVRRLGRFSQHLPAVGSPTKLGRASIRSSQGRRPLVPSISSRPSGHSLNRSSCAASMMSARLDAIPGEIGFVAEQAIEFGKAGPRHWHRLGDRRLVARNAEQPRPDDPIEGDRRGGLRKEIPFDDPDDLVHPRPLLGLPGVSGGLGKTSSR